MGFSGVGDFARSYKELYEILTVVFEKRHLSLLLMPTTRDVSRGEMAVSAGYYNGHEKVSFAVRFCWRLRCQIVRFRLLSVGMSVGLSGL